MSFEELCLDAAYCSSNLKAEITFRIETIVSLPLGCTIYRKKSNLHLAFNVEIKHQELLQRTLGNLHSFVT